MPHLIQSKVLRGQKPLWMEQTSIRAVAPWRLNMPRWVRDGGRFFFFLQLCLNSKSLSIWTNFKCQFSNKLLLKCLVVPYVYWKHGLDWDERYLKIIVFEIWLKVCKCRSVVPPCTVGMIIRTLLDPFIFLLLIFMIRTVLYCAMIKKKKHLNSTLYYFYWMISAGLACGQCGKSYRVHEGIVLSILHLYNSWRHIKDLN